MKLADQSQATRINDRLHGVPLGIMLDLDGTLAPIVMHPASAALPDVTRRVVAALAARDDVRLAIVSGRAALDARRLLAPLRVWIVGNHGAEVLSPDGTLAVDEYVVPYASALARVANALSGPAAAIPGVIVENKTWSLAVHWRMADPLAVPLLRERVEGEAAAAGLRVTEGNAVFEVRPPVDVHKGTAVMRLANQLGVLAPGASLVYAGDDATDEDAFRALRRQCPDAVTIHVGPRRLGDATVGQEETETAAEFVLASPEGVRVVLESILRDRR